MWFSLSTSLIVKLLLGIFSDFRMAMSELRLENVVNIGGGFVGLDVVLELLFFVALSSFSGSMLSSSGEVLNRFTFVISLLVVMDSSGLLACAVFLGVIHSDVGKVELVEAGMFLVFSVGADVDGSS